MRVRAFLLMSVAVVAATWSATDQSPAGATRPTSTTAPTPAAAIGWRGDGSGIFAGAQPPTAWDEDSKKNILWSAKVGKSDHGGLIVVGKKVFLLREPEHVVCLDADSGKLLWEKANGREELPTLPDDAAARGETGNTSPTPCSDGKNIYVWFGIGIAACYDLDGDRKWIEYLPGMSGDYGRAASPVLVGDKLVIMCGEMTALDLANGKTLWRCQQVPEEYGTPVVSHIGDVAVLVGPGGQVVRTSDGKVLHKGLAKNLYASAICAGQQVFYADVTSYALELPKIATDNLELKKLWSEDLEGDFYSSGVVWDGILYAVCDQGTLYANDANTGQNIWKQELDIPSSSGRPGSPPGHLFPSLAIAGGHLYVTNDRGDTLVLEPGRQYKELGRGKINEGSGASLFFAGKRIYARGGEFIYCLGNK